MNFNTKTKYTNNNNVDTDKLKILLDNKGKSGIYCFTNLTNGKKYVGSSTNLRRRFLEYLNTNHLIKQEYMYINRALLKYGYHNFSLENLEHCPVSELLTKEKHYIDLLKPVYNISQEPSSPFLGRNHSAESRALIRSACLGRKISEETKAKISASVKRVGFPHPDCIKIKVIDLETNISTDHDSMRAAARALDCSIYAIRYYFKSKKQKPYKGRYVFKIIED